MDLLDIHQKMDHSPHTKMLREYDDFMRKIDELWQNADEEVRGILGPDYRVDEMAMLFPDKDILVGFMAKSLQNGWVVFNYSEDEVKTSPIPSGYGVRYWFLRHEQHDYRLELMQLLDGFSPYHSMMSKFVQDENLPFTYVHASFKVSTEDQFAAAGVAFRNAGFDLLQHCESSYGKFSYYYDSSRRDVGALKPRINTRDGATHA